jgi:hypothetical protein
MGKPHTLISKFIDIGSLVQSASIAADSPRSMIIGHNENNIHRFLLILAARHHY